MGCSNRGSKTTSRTPSPIRTQSFTRFCHTNVMAAYIFRRLISVVPISLGVLFVTFLLFRVIGGNPAYRIAGKNATPAKIAQITHDRGYDQPYFLNFKGFPRQLFHAQFPRLVRSILRGDFGESITNKMRVSELLRAGLLPSLCVTTPLFIVDLCLAVGLALLAAYFRGTWIDRSLVVGAVMAMSISEIVYIMIAQYWLASEWRLFPVWGFEGPQYLVLPALAVAFDSTGRSCSTKSIRITYAPRARKAYRPRESCSIMFYAMP